MVNDVDRLAEMGLQVVAADLLAAGDSVRHDPRASAEVALQLAKRGQSGPPQSPRSWRALANLDRQSK